jgi:hypothetical protein
MDLCMFGDVPSQQLQVQLQTQHNGVTGNNGQTRYKVDKLQENINIEKTNKWR